MKNKEKICLICGYQRKVDGKSNGCYHWHRKVSDRHTYKFRKTSKDDIINLITKSNHECCDGECNHDDCCGKIPKNCPNNKNK